MGPSINEEDFNFLDAPILDDEIKNALFHIGDDKAPGPDGFYAAFFKSNWDLVERDFLQAAQEFFNSGKFLKQFNHAALALIPKSKHAPEAKDFKPISCCNVFYKTISKVIANKLAKVVPNIIDPAQCAFLEDRIMSDHVLLAQQLIRNYGRKSSSPRCMLKVDLRKAFDTVSWPFILNLLDRLGFPTGIIIWIKQCITTSSFSISLNGKMHCFLKTQRGLRQGDPISPYLFVLAMEYLSRSLKVATANPSFRYHPKCKQIGLTHLSFTNDIIFFSRGDTQSVSLIIDTLNHFGNCSGLEINLSKSHLFDAGVVEPDLQDLLAITGFSPGSFPVTYLGSPLVHGKLKSCHFNPLIERITNFINSWSAHNLSYAGKLELLQAVIQGVESFWIQNYPIPTTVTDKINKICRKFLWGGSKPKVA